MFNYKCISYIWLENKNKENIAPGKQSEKENNIVSVIVVLLLLSLFSKINIIRDRAFGTIEKFLFGCRAWTIYIAYILNTE